MKNQDSKERSELEKVIAELKKIQKGNTGKDIVEAIIDEISEDNNQDIGKVARPKQNINEEIQPTI